MSSINLISRVITTEQLTQFEALVTELEVLLPDVLVGLSPDKRRS